MFDNGENKNEKVVSRIICHADTATEQLISVISLEEGHQLVPGFKSYMSCQRGSPIWRVLNSVLRKKVE